jgi:hypothetical protein
MCIKTFIYFPEDKAYLDGRYCSLGLSPPPIFLVIQGSILNGKSYLEFSLIKPVDVFKARY